MMQCDLCDSIQLTCGKRAIVDPQDRQLVGLTGWKAKLSRGGWYAYKPVITKNETRYVYMHRLIAHTPKGMICHHRNGNGLYNRRANLQNMTPNEHEQLSRMLRIARKEI